MTKWKKGDQKMQAFFFEEPFEDNYWSYIFKEIYIDKIYHPYLSKTKNPVCLEIGANAGLVSYFFAQHFDKVFAVEPAREHFKHLIEMIKFNKLEDVIIPINRAIYCKEADFDFFHNKNKTMFSLNPAVSDSPETEKVHAITMDQLFEQNNITHVDLLKLDTEGAEVEIFSSEGFSKVAPMIDTIVTEIHSWNGRHPNQIKDALENNGFTVKTIDNDATLLVATRL